MILSRVDIFCFHKGCVFTRNNGQLNKRHNLLGIVRGYCRLLFPLVKYHLLSDVLSFVVVHSVAMHHDHFDPQMSS